MLLIRDFRRNGDFNLKSIKIMSSCVVLIRDFRRNGDFNIRITHFNDILSLLLIRDFRRNGDFNGIISILL